MDKFVNDKTTIADDISYVLRAFKTYMAETVLAILGVGIFCGLAFAPVPKDADQGARTAIAHLATGLITGSGTKAFTKDSREY